MCDFAEYIKEQVDNGYITSDGEPLKCQFCNSIDLHRGKQWVESMGVVEYEVECTSCKKVVGYWSYGNWQV